jgi:hypothetical protein
MTTFSSHPFAEKSRLSRAFPFVLVAGLALLGVLICFVGQQALQAEGGKGFATATLFNQANADARAGKTAQAIVAYKRAEFLSPGDENIRANLNWVRTHAGLPIVSQTLLGRSVSWAGPNALAWLGTAGLILVGTSWVLARPRTQRRGFFLGIGVCGLALLALSMTSAVLAWQTSQQAVVLTRETPARIAPTTVSEVAFKLPAGAVAAMEGRHGSFILVADASGHTGWVNQSDLEPILSHPSASPL